MHPRQETGYDPNPCCAENTPQCRVDSCRTDVHPGCQSRVADRCLGRIRRCPGYLRRKGPSAIVRVRTDSGKLLRLSFCNRWTLRRHRDGQERCGRSAGNGDGNIVEAADHDPGVGSRIGYVHKTRDADDDEAIPCSQTVRTDGKRMRTRRHHLKGISRRPDQVAGVGRIQDSERIGRVFNRRTIRPRHEICGIRVPGSCRRRLRSGQCRLRGLLQCLLHSPDSWHCK